MSPESVQGHLPGWKGFSVQVVDRTGFCWLRWSVPPALTIALRGGLGGGSLKQICRH